MATAAETKAAKAKATKTQDEKAAELVDAIAPPVKRRDQLVQAGPDSPYVGFKKTYTQQKLNFFGKIEFTRVVSSAVKKVMSGENGVSFTDLIGTQNGRDQDQADIFISGISSLLEYAPAIVKDVYLISLGVPAHERQVVSEIWDEPANEDGSGGLSDEDGLAILNTFVQQNAKVMRDFFMVHLNKTLREAQTLVSPSDPTQES